MTKYKIRRMMLVAGIAFFVIYLIGADAWYDYIMDQNVQLVKNINMTGNPEGPTLEECIDSYYGEDVSWRPLTDNLVDIEAYRDEQSLHMRLQVNRKTGNADLIYVFINLVEPTEQEFNRMIDAWIQAAR